MADTTVDATRRLNVKKQTLDDAYAAPANFLEIDVINPITHGVGKKRYTDYEVRMRVSNSRVSLQISSPTMSKHACRMSGCVKILHSPDILSLRRRQAHSVKVRRSNSCNSIRCIMGSACYRNDKSRNTFLSCFKADASAVYYT